MSIGRSVITMALDTLDYYFEFQLAKAKTTVGKKM